jgi:hypothetical protein
VHEYFVLVIVIAACRVGLFSISQQVLVVLGLVFSWMRLRTQQLFAPQANVVYEVVFMIHLFKNGLPLRQHKPRW